MASDYGDVATNKATATPLTGQGFSRENVYSFPNPSSGMTTIKFSLEGPAEVYIGIYEVNGRLIWQDNLNPAETRTGPNSVIWEGRDQAGTDVPDGVYLLRVRSGNIMVTKKIAIVR
jgi:flagellar hook assembly protein FlgD